MVKNIMLTFRFMGKMPIGRFEYTCNTCGNYEITRITEGKGTKSFACKKCGVSINIWEQSDHWHISIGNKE